MKFDNLHRLENYFEPMVLSVDSKARRRELAELLTDAFLYFFSVFEVHSLYKSMLEKAMYEQLLADKISDAVSKVTGIDSEMSGHIRTLAKQVVDTTYKHTEQTRQNSPTNTDSESFSNTNINPSVHVHTQKQTSALFGHNESLDSPYAYANATMSSDSLLKDNDSDSDGNGKDYWLSLNRASDIGYSEANTFFNYTDYKEAQERGCTKKTWHTMLDPKVRDTHEEIEGQTIGIDEMFYVGNSQMRFPHDWESNPNPAEVVNCRCAVDYQ